MDFRAVGSVTSILHSSSELSTFTPCCFFSTASHRLPSLGDYVRCCIRLTLAKCQCLARTRWENEVDIRHPHSYDSSLTCEPRAASPSPRRRSSRNECCGLRLEHVGSRPVWRPSSYLPVWRPPSCQEGSLVRSEHGSVRLEQLITKSRHLCSLAAASCLAGLVLWQRRQRFLTSSTSEHRSQKGRRGVLLAAHRPSPC